MSDKPLSREMYLQALGLFTMARLHADRASEFRDELKRLLGGTSDLDLGHVEDAVWSGDGRPSAFDEALRREGFDARAAQETGVADRR